MTGIAALVLCFGFTSCSHDLDSLSQQEIDQLEAQKIVNTYQKAFKAYIGGEVSPTQTWGFGPATSARTRTASTNANEWANTYKVPTQLTPAQKLRITRYFQTHKNPGGQDNKGIKTYFVQQVYDGATDPITQYSGYSSPTYSTEVYKAADNINYIESGKHMDHLTAGEGTDR